MIFSPLSIPFLILGGAIGLIAMLRLQSTYAKYKNVPQSRGLTGAEVAQAILDKAGIRDVSIEPCPGRLTDHYDPRARILRLSEDNFHTSSIAAIGVAAHEAGHALQHQEKYLPLELRMSVVGITNFSSGAAPLIFALGFFLHMPSMLQIGIWLYSAIVVFQLITLPVEYDASSRAKRVLADLGLVNREEGEAIRKMLSAAALTYVAALITAILQLIDMIFVANQSRNRN
jgi:Zn-dependent membrane protease YugP